MRTEIFNTLTELLKNEDIKAINSGVNEQIKLYKELIYKEKSEENSNEKETEEESEKIEKTEEELSRILEERHLDTTISKLIEDFKTRKKEHHKKIVEEQKHNLITKKAILKEFVELVENEENIGVAFAKKKEIQERWKEIGNVPQDKFEEIQSQYSSLNDTFNYNINIYKEIKDHDLKRNYSLKNKLIFDLKELLNEPSIRKTQDSMHHFLTQWDEIGPTFQEEWEKLKEGFWGTINEIRAKINAHYDELKAKFEENLVAKEALIVKAKELNSQSFDSIKTWNEATKQAIELQEEWKKTGQATKERNQEVWDEFRGVFDDLFGRKNAYFKTLKQDSAKNAILKKEIIAKAEELKMSDQWKDTTRELINLQNQWKEVGFSGNNDQKLWKQFRTACDFFFNNKKEYYGNREGIETENLTKKQALVKEIEELKLSENTTEAIGILKEYSIKFLEIGNVPFKEKDVIYNAYKKSLDVHYDKLKLDRSEKARISYNSKLEGMKSKPNSGNAINKERDYLKRKLNTLNQEKLQYENNLGFFAFSKGKAADKMKADVEKKIKQKEEEIKTIRQKLKLISNAK